MPSFAKFFGRTGTRSKYGKTPERALPSARTEATEIEDENAEQDKKKDAAVDEQVEEAEDKKKVETAGAMTKLKGKKTVKKNIASNVEGTSTSASASDMFSLFWATVTTHYMHALTFNDKVWFVPNALPLFTISEIFFRLVGSTNWIAKHEPTFNPYACHVAICYVYYIQILRAREAAGALTGNETSILTRFRKAFPEEKIDIPGVFVPYLESIVATEPSDNKYPWIVPYYGDLDGLTDFQEFRNNANLNYMRPAIPLLLANLATFAATAPTDLDAHMNDNQQYEPVIFNRANASGTTRIYNHDYDFQSGAAPGNAPHAWDDRYKLFLTGGQNVPFGFYNDNYAAAHKHIRRQAFLDRQTGISFGATNNLTYPSGGANNLQETINVHTLETFLVAEKTRSLHWADYIFDQLSIASKHSKFTRNLSQIATTGGMESTIYCNLRTYTPHNHNGANRYTYENDHMGIANAAGISWYNGDHLNRLTARFQTSRADVEREEELQGFSFGINATMPFHGAARNVSGSFYTHATNANGAADAMVYSEQGDEADTVRGPVDMYSGWEKNVIRPAFLTKPEGQ